MTAALLAAVVMASSSAAVRVHPDRPAVVHRAPGELSSTEMRLLGLLKRRGYLPPALTQQLPERHPRWRNLMDAVLAERQLGYLEFPTEGGLSLFLLPAHSAHGDVASASTPPTSPDSMAARARERAGTRHREAVARLDGLRGCYERQSGLRRSTRTSVDVLVKIRPDGRVKDVKVDGKPDLPAAAACAVGVALTWSFPTSFRESIAVARFALPEDRGASSSISAESHNGQGPSERRGEPAANGPCKGVIEAAARRPIRR